MAEHTPAPWKVIPTLNGYNDKVCAIAEEADNGSIIAQMLNLPEQEANARLIAAAPETAAERDKLFVINAELLEALETLMGGIYNFTNIPLEVKNFVYTTAKVARAKAEQRLKES